MERRSAVAVHQGIQGSRIGFSVLCDAFEAGDDVLAGGFHQLQGVHTVGQLAGAQGFHGLFAVAVDFAVRSPW